MQRRARLLCTVALLFFALYLSAQEVDPLGQEEDAPPSVLNIPSLPVAVGFTWPYVDLDISPHAVMGTHTQALGTHLRAQFSFPEILILENLFIFTQIHYFYSFKNVGIPQPSHTGYFSGALGLSVGQKGTLDNGFFPIGDRAHTTIYQYQYFLDTIGTSQASGILGYFFSRPTWLIGFIYDNDILAFNGFDRFRTAAVELVSLFTIAERVAGVGLGVKQWGGTTENEDRRGHRGMSVDVSDDYGGEYSHGILYLAAYYERIKFSIGWDSEDVRAAFQNGVHFFFNQSLIAYNPNIPDRFFIQIEINPRFSLY